MKIAAFKLAGVALSLSLAWTSAQAAALRVAADPVPHAEILNYIKKIDPSLDLKVVELTSGVNANELLANGDVDVNYFQHVPYLKDQEAALARPSPSPPRSILSRWLSIRASTKTLLHCRKMPPSPCPITPPT